MSASERLVKPAYGPETNPRLEFAEGQFRFRSVNQEGAIIERFISSEAVREAFSGIPIDSGWLPPEIARWGNGRLGEWVVAFIPPGLHELELTREDPGKADSPYSVNVTVDRITTPLPGLVLFGHSNQYYIWAVRTERLKPDHEIYRCPLPNVEETGLICWGPFKPPRCTPKTIGEAFQLFIKSTFNNHRANAKSKANREDVRIMLRELAQVQLTVAEVSTKLRNEVWKQAMKESGGDFALHNEIYSRLVDELVEAAHRTMPTAVYPVKDLERQVPHTGVTLDQALRSYFAGEGMPA